MQCKIQTMMGAGGRAVLLVLGCALLAAAYGKEASTHYHLSIAEFEVRHIFALWGHDLPARRPSFCRPQRTILFEWVAAM